MLEHHPYGTFVPKKPRAMIVGSFPIGKFSHPKRRHEIKPHEFDFFFGGEKNLLWKLLSRVFETSIRNKKDIVKMLTKEGLAIGDVIKSCRRKEGGGSDSDLYDIRWNHELIDVIHQHKIGKVYFTSRQVEKWFKKLFPEEKNLEMVTLISPSAQSARSIVRMAEYVAWKVRHPQEKTFEFLVEKYKELIN